MKSENYNKILVVDDDTDMGSMIKMILEYKGFNVTSLKRGEHAKQIMKENDIDLLILDMLLSGVNGTEICAEIKKDPLVANIPVIMISAHPDAKKTCMEAGADAFLSKPFDLQDMLLKINNYIPKNKSLKLN